MNPTASYTGWTAGKRWEEAPFDYFINTDLTAEKIRRVARLAEATKLSLAINRGKTLTSGISLRPPVAYPFR